jgi:hypothetical protein
MTPTETPTPPKVPSKPVRSTRDGGCVLRALRSALNDTLTSDLKVIVRGTPYHVHRLIVSLQSKMFASMLSGGYQEAVNGAVVIDEYEPEHVYAALEWMYSGAIALTADSVIEVLRVAEYMQLDDLVTSCRSLAADLITCVDVVPLLQSALKHEEADLTAACLAFWGDHPIDIAVQPAFYHASIDTLHAMLTHPEINCEEAVLFWCAMEWIRRRGYLTGACAEKVLGFAFTEHADANQVEHVVVPAGAPPQSDSRAADSEGSSTGEGSGSELHEFEHRRRAIERIVGSIRLGQLHELLLVTTVKHIVKDYSVLQDEFSTAVEHKLGLGSVDEEQKGSRLMRPRENAWNMSLSVTLTPQYLTSLWSTTADRELTVDTLRIGLKLAMEGPLHVFGAACPPSWTSMAAGSDFCGWMAKSPVLLPWNYQGRWHLFVVETTTRPLRPYTLHHWKLSEDEEGVARRPEFQAALTGAVDRVCGTQNCCGLGFRNQAGYPSHVGTLGQTGELALVPNFSRPWTAGQSGMAVVGAVAKLCRAATVDRASIREHLRFEREPTSQRVP